MTLYTATLWAQKMVLYRGLHPQAPEVRRPVAAHLDEDVQALLNLTQVRAFWEGLEFTERIYRIRHDSYGMMFVSGPNSFDDWKDAVTQLLTGDA